MLIYLIRCLFVALTLYPNSIVTININSDKWCFDWVVIITWCYHLSKSTIYLIFILRIEMAFGDSAFQYQKWVFYVYYALLLGFTVLWSICDVLFTNGIWDVQGDQLVCQSRYATWGVLISGFFDIILSLMPLYLFNKPLYKMARKVETMPTSLT